MLIATLLALLTGCDDVRPPNPTLPAEPSTQTPAPASDEEAIEMLLRAESEGVVNRDLDRLMGLWIAECLVVDARHTPDNPGDDLTWKGSYAVRDRYITLVFPGNPSQAGPADLVIVIDDDRAEVTATTRIGAEVSPAGDRWTFVRTPDGWRIESLTYNLEPE